MRVPLLHALPLLACLLAGCSALILEEVGEISVPHDCAEPTKLFNTFAMRATSISWHGEAAGVTFSREPKKLKEARSVPLFSQQKNAAKSATQIDNVLDVNFRIRPDKPEKGKLVFEVPRDNYLLTIERKFAGKPVEGIPTDHLSACKISGNESLAMKPASPRGVSGVY